MKILGVIPCRYESSRFPGKPLINLNGKTMIERVYEQCKKSKMISEVFVATDDVRIFEHVEKFGGNAIMTSKKHKSGTDRCGEVACLFPEYDVIINIQGDEPLINPKQIDQLCYLFKNKKIEIGTLAKKINTNHILFNPHRVKIAIGENNRALYFSRSPIPFLKDEKKENWLTKNDYYTHIGIYGYRSKTLKKIVSLTPTAIEKQESLEQLRWLYYGFFIFIGFSEFESPCIDTPEDVDLVLDILRKHKNSSS